MGLILLFLFCAKFCPMRAKAIYFPHLSYLFLGSKQRSYLQLFTKWFALILAIVALASPIYTTEYSNSKKNGRDIVLIVDTSESMRQQGFDASNRAKNKFEVVQEVASEFVRKRENDRVGLITFADIAFVASPLTFEKKFLEKIIEMQRLGIAGKRTAINDALVQSYAMLERSKAKSKIVILLTDGVDNMSEVSVDEVTSLVSKSDIKLYTIGVGTERDFDGVYLKRLANAGKGVAFAARNATMLTKIYAEIDRLEASKIDDKRVVKHRYLFTYPLIFSILLLFFFIYLRAMRSVA